MSIGCKVIIVDGSSTCFDGGQVGTVRDMTSFSVGVYIDGMVQWYAYSDVIEVD